MEKKLADLSPAVLRAHTHTVIEERKIERK